MISKTSWFNKGVYLCALKRFLWGSVLYFVLLFLCTVMPILGTDPTALIEGMHTHGVILRMDFLAVPLLLSFCVPTVVAVLSFRFIHSKRMSVFMHSLPISRTAHFTATLLADFTLMLVPVLLNGLMLMLISCNGYAMAFSVADCGIWMLANSWSLFLMFAVAVLSAQLTGNSFAAVGINVLLHIFVPLLVVCVKGLAETFVHGFSGDYTWLEMVLNQEFVVHIWQTLTWLWDGFYSNTTYTVLLYVNLALAVVCYGVSFVLYQKRQMETSEDVAAFPWFAPILKYCVAFLGTLTVCAISVGLYASTAWSMLLVLLLTSFVLYFGTEMLLKKSFRVWKAYKGYVVFAVILVGLAVGLPQSNYLGYETYVPQANAVQSVTVDGLYGFSEVPLHRGENITDKAVIETVLAWHDKLAHTENAAFGGHMYLQYKLKNGRTVSRQYIISEANCRAVYEDLTAHTAYKEAVFDYQWPSLDRVTAIYVNQNDSGEGILDKTEIAELYGCIRQDYMEVIFPVSQNEYLETDAEGAENEEDSFEIIISYTEKNSTDEYMQGISLSAKYTKTCAWLKAHQYAYPKA